MGLTSHTQVDRVERGKLNAGTRALRRGRTSRVAFPEFDHGVDAATAVDRRAPSTAAWKPHTGSVRRILNRRIPDDLGQIGRSPGFGGPPFAR